MASYVSKVLSNVRAFFSTLSPGSFDLTQLPPYLHRLCLEVEESIDLLARELAVALRKTGAVVDSALAGAAVLRIPQSKFRIEPVASTKGRVADKKLFMRNYVMFNSVEIEATDSAGHVVLPRQSIEISREFVVDETKFSEVLEIQGALRHCLRKDMVRAILRKIQTQQYLVP